ncbi:MAG: response regulator transcription factor [Alphaproteobacteria bacterium]|nr:response regulator transcription factor [Alphaproteobacteria bacterium]
MTQAQTTPIKKQRKTILVADDDKEIRDMIALSLDPKEYQIFPAMTGKRYKEILSSEMVDLVLLDLTLPDMDGLDLIDYTRNITNVPIIILSARASTDDKIKGLEKGVDDYVGKPFHPEELTARIETNIQRYRALNNDSHGGKPTLHTATTISLDGWVMDRRKMQVMNIKGEVCGLTTHEFRLLEALVIFSPQVLSRDELYAHLTLNSDDKGNMGERAIDIGITRLRKKLGDNPKNPSIIRTCRGMGYQLICDTNILD